MRVLITRPIDDARETEMQLRALGHSVLIAPLLSIQFDDSAKLDLSGVQAILATSANGVRALARHNPGRDLPVFAVGPQTAATARAAGFTSIRSADGDVVALANAIPTWTTPANGVLLHASGADGEGRLAAALQEKGFTVRTEYLYEVRSVGELQRDASAALAGGLVDAVLLYSPRSARTFADCVMRAGLSGAAAKLVGVCISHATAIALAPLVLAEVRLAERPNQEAMLKCLG